MSSRLVVRKCLRFMKLSRLLLVSIAFGGLLVEIFRGSGRHRISSLGCLF